MIKNKKSNRTNINIDIDLNLNVVFLGLSNKEGIKPFDNSTNSGKVVDMIIDLLNDTLSNNNEKELSINISKRNLVPYAPLDENGKLRYPSNKEIEEELPKLKKYINTLEKCKIVAFGNIVQKKIECIESSKNEIIYAKHPSYIYVYKRRELQEYIKGIVNEIIK